MDTQGQIKFFLLYVAFGFLSGIVYEFFACLRLFCGCDGKRRAVLGGIFDVLFWLCICGFLGVCAYCFHLPDLRVYMWIGLLLGGIIYYKTLRRILAFLEKLCYNTCKRIVKKVKIGRKSTQKKVGSKV